MSGGAGEKEDNEITFEDCSPSTLFREFAAECMELAKTKSSPKKRALYLKMARAPDGAALGKEKLAAPSIETNLSLERSLTRFATRYDFVAHSFVT